MAYRCNTHTEPWVSFESSLGFHLGPVGLLFTNSRSHVLLCVGNPENEGSEWRSRGLWCHGDTIYSRDIFVLKGLLFASMKRNEYPFPSSFFLGIPGLMKAALPSSELG